MSRIFASLTGAAAINAVQYSRFDADRDAEVAEIAQGQGWTVADNGAGLTLTKGGSHYDLTPGDWIARAVVAGGALSSDIIVITNADMASGWRQLG